MNKSSTFQIILITIFGASVFIALFIFATFHASNSTTLSRITLWGTVSASDFNTTFSAYNTANGNKLDIVYVQKKPESFDQDFIEAIASGNGPDAIIFPQDLIMREQDKLYAIPESILPLRTFQDAFVDEAGLYVTPQGIVGLPLSIDPLVMYWNKDIFNTAGIVYPPKTWNEFLTLVPKLTQRDAASNITQSAVALGEFTNIDNAKEILSALFFQAGNPIMASNSNGVLTSTLDDTSGGNSGAQSVLSFYGQFSNLDKTLYSWNRSLPYSQDAFIAGDLAVYFGFASEYNSIKLKNPNLNFDVTSFPQPYSAKTKLTFGRMNGLAVVKSSRQINSAFQTIYALSGPVFSSLWSSATKSAPARRDLLSQVSTDPNVVIFNNSALISRAWLDPNPSATNGVFQDMIEGVNFGQRSPADSISNASNQLNNIVSPH
jgi:ABC-type glycerol-3-phosphate transport system substrate-binding protein